MLDKDAIRSLIRDVIAEEVRQLKRNGEPPRAHGAETSVSVTISGDADLAAFARKVLELSKDPQLRAAIEAGRHPFRLVSDPGNQRPADGPASKRHRIDKGVVTEAVIAKLGDGTTSLELGPGVTVTPLARDKARAAGISIERTRQ